MTNRFINVLQQIQRPPKIYHLNGQDETKGTATAHRVTYTRNMVGSLTWEDVRGKKIAKKTDGIHPLEFSLKKNKNIFFFCCCRLIQRIQLEGMDFERSSLSPSPSLSTICWWMYKHMLLLLLLLVFSFKNRSALVKWIFLFLLCVRSLTHHSKHRQIKIIIIKNWYIYIVIYFC